MKLFSIFVELLKCLIVYLLIKITCKDKKIPLNSAGFYRTIVFTFYLVREEPLGVLPPEFELLELPEERPLLELPEERPLLELPEERPLPELLVPEELLLLGRLTLPDPERPLLLLLLGRVLLELLPVRPLLLLLPLGRLTLPELELFPEDSLPVRPLEPGRVVAPGLLDPLVLGRVVAPVLVLEVGGLVALGSRELMLPGVLEVPGRATVASVGLL